jgi:hypothetical protein
VAVLGDRERHMKTVGQEGDKDVCFNARPKVWHVGDNYKSAEEALQSKRRQAGADGLKWLEPLGTELREAKGVALLREVLAQQYELEQSG